MKYEKKKERIFIYLFMVLILGSNNSDLLLVEKLDNIVNMEN